MILFEKDMHEEKISKYETNHFHMIIDGNIQLPANTMSNKEYGTFLHEYIHYLQHITTLFGIKVCAMYNNKFALYRQYLSENNTIELPLLLWEKEGYEDLTNFRKQFESIKGDIDSIKCNQNIDAVEVDIREIQKAKISRTAVNIGIYDFDNMKEKEDGFLFGYSCIIESMAHLIQSFINEDTNHATIPYHSVELICRNYYKEIAEDRKMMISICLCSLMFDNPGCGFFDVIKVSRENKELNGLELYQKIMRDYPITYGKNQMPIYRALYKFLDEFKDNIEASIGSPLNYYAKVMEHCKKEASSGNSVLLDIIYNGDISDKNFFDEVLGKVYGTPFIEADNVCLMPSKKEIDVIETTKILTLELLIKRLENKKNTECDWFKICKKTMYTDPNSAVTPDCVEAQWNKTETCLMTKAMNIFGIKDKEYVQTAIK